MKKIKKNEEVDVIELFNHSDEFSLFTTHPVLDMIQFRWDTYGFQFHIVGFIFHFFQLIILVIYTVDVYIRDGLYEYIETDDLSVMGGLERVPKN